MNKDMQSSTPGSARSGLAQDSRSERDTWIHEFRNALGNITIAASAVKSELADHQNEQFAESIRHIEEGCERCLRLLRSMPC